MDERGFVLTGCSMWKDHSWTHKVQFQSEIQLTLMKQSPKFPNVRRTICSPRPSSQFISKMKLFPSTLAHTESSSFRLFTVRSDHLYHVPNMILWNFIS
ncbi:unnamed protein product [Linum tenue]|uniref:Uncharacterized protein n=1 Tax=Linum tenue TaxID=586396 RepID=A0AAV0K465_9ROSI|nr:unnamed protein product [Linum tenue]